MSGVFSFVILGLVQGLTEFLPISSSGHLVLISNYFGIEESLFVSIILHVATLLSVCVVMRRELWHLIRHPFSKEMRNLALSTIITLAIALLLYNFAKVVYVESYIPFFFMITASVLILTDIFAPKRSFKEVGAKQSAIMGIAQGLAVFPGVSRSGSTICAGLMAGGDKESVAKQSFLMSLPIIVASLLLEIVEFSTSGLSLNTPIIPLLLGFLIAFMAGVLTLKFMIKITCKVKFRYFSIYLIALALILLFI